MLRIGENARRAGVVATTVVGAVAAALLAAMAILPLVVPAAELRRTAAQALAGSTGQEVVIQGEPSLKLLPSPRVVLGRVSFPLPAGQSLEAENVVARLDLWQFLTGRVDVDDVVVERPTLVLDGEGIVPALAVAPMLAGAERPELRIVDGTIAWRAPDGLTRELVSGLTASLDRIAEGRGIALAAAFDWRDERVTATVILDDVPAVMAGTPAQTRVVLATDGAKLRFEGRAALGAGAMADGTVSAEAESLRDLLAWAGSEVPVRGGFGPFALTSQVALEKGEAALTDTSVELDGNRGDGALLVKLVQGRPVVQGTIAADRLDLSPYGGLQLTTDQGRVWDRHPVDLGPLEGFDLDLRLSAGRVTAGDSVLSTVAASAVLTGGRLVLALGEARSWGGLIRAALTLAPAGPQGSGGQGAPRPVADPADRTLGGEAPGAEVRLEAEATDVDLGRALEDVAGMRRIEGTGTLQLDVAGTGDSVLGIARNLAGSLSLTAANGYLSGFDVAQVLQRIERRPLSAVADSRGGRTAFADLSARIAITDGLGTVEEMQLAGKQVRLAMQGSVSIAERSLDLAGHASLVPAGGKGAGGGKGTGSGTGGIDLPFSVRGPWDTPTVMADPLSLIERSDAAQSLLEAVKSRASTVAAEPALHGAPGAAPHPAD